MLLRPARLVCLVSLLGATAWGGFTRGFDPPRLDVDGKEVLKEAGGTLELRHPGHPPGYVPAPLFGRWPDDASVEMRGGFISVSGRWDLHRGKSEISARIAEFWIRGIRLGRSARKESGVCGSEDVKARANTSEWTNPDAFHPYVTHLQLRGLEYRDTGYIRCMYEGTENLEAIENVTGIYLYVKDAEHLLVESGGGPKVIQVRQYKSVDIPCRPTSPEINVTIWRNQQVGGGAGRDSRGVLLLDGMGCRLMLWCVGVGDALCMSFR
ncbi:unnamed protein product [Darwinula stevensoni]|uniref:Uncharacterized protein n=1 Tax=Darwinula stevensoni TaxID=69355 RepID=A0A7R8X8H6_9CRUS|nr:unnamed protein product [Darwinula stevensoni]CAG0881554.1 unnamed protein product [Darwinula stevensoni]